MTRRLVCGAVLLALAAGAAHAGQSVNAVLLVKSPGAGAASAASQRAGAVLLVNSLSDSYGDAQHFIRPYLDNFGVPYTVLDIATTQVGAGIGDYALIIVGHRRLDPAHTRLGATAQANLSAAVRNGAGLVNFDNDLSPDGTTARYQYVQDIFGFGYVAAPTGGDVTFPASAPTAYITARHAAGDVVTTGAMTLAGVTLSATTASLASVLSVSQPFLAVGTLGLGRAVQWGSYDWMSVAVKGPVYGLDDLVWRSLVWAARKPFVMQGLPNFLTMRVDDAQGGFTWLQTANDFGLKPWLGLFYHDISDADAAVLSTVVNAGKATAAIHARSYAPGAGDFFYFDHYNVADLPDGTVASYYTEATSWLNTHGIPSSKYVVPHYYEFGTNIFGGLQNWGVQFVGVQIAPGGGYDSSTWVQDGPYRLYDTPGPASTSIPGYYADYLSVPGHPELANQFFNCMTEIRDDTGYEWHPDNDVAGSIGRGTRQTRRALDSMALSTLFAHEYYIQPIDPNSWRSILSGITANLASYSPRYVTLDYACQYLRAMKTSDISTSVYDTATRVLTTSLTGTADIPTQLYVFNENGGVVTAVLVDAPAFSGSAQVVYQLPGPVTRVVVTPASAEVATGGTQAYQAQGYDANNTAVPGLSYAWSTAGGGTIDQNGVFTAGGTPGLYTNTVTAAAGVVSGQATPDVYTPVLDHFAFGTIGGAIYSGTPFPVRITAYDQHGAVLANYAGSTSLTDTTGTIAPTSTGSFAAGVWSGSVSIGRSAAGVILTASAAGAGGQSNALTVLASSGPVDITFNCWYDSHQNPVLLTTMDATALSATDGRWTEFSYPAARPYPAVFAGVGEATYGLPVMRFYTSGLQNGTYEVRATLYTDTARNIRYFYGYQPTAPKASYIDTQNRSGGTEQFAEFSLGTVIIADGTFDIYVQDAALLSGSYPFFGWATVRLIQQSAVEPLAHFALGPVSGPVHAGVPLAVAITTHH